MKPKAQYRIKELVERYPALAACKIEIEQAAEVMMQAYRQDKKFMICGNGGSAADSLHIVGELVKAFALPRHLDLHQQDVLHKACPKQAEYYIKNLQQAAPAISLVSEIALTTAYGNDQASDLIFAQQVFGQGREGDVLIAISTSGNSANILHALEVGKAFGITCVGLSGQTGGKMKEKCDICICAPAIETFKVQEYHLPIYHALCLAIEEEFFEDK